MKTGGEGGEAWGERCKDKWWKSEKMMWKETENKRRRCQMRQWKRNNNVEKDNVKHAREIKKKQSETRREMKITFLKKVERWCRRQGHEESRGGSQRGPRLKHWQEKRTSRWEAERKHLRPDTKEERWRQRGEMKWEGRWRTEEEEEETWERNYIEVHEEKRTAERWRRQNERRWADTVWRASAAATHTFLTLHKIQSVS